MLPDASYTVVCWDDENLILTVTDTGDHTKQRTITNDAEGVVSHLLALIKERHPRANLGAWSLLYYDSTNELAELVHNGVEFTGFGYNIQHKEWK